MQFLCLSQLISAQFALETCLAVRNRQKIHKTPILASKVIQVIEFGGNREPVYDFLLVINSNLSPISHRFRDVATYHNFPYPLLFNVPARGNPFRIYGKILRILKLESSRQLAVKIWRS